MPSALAVILGQNSQPSSDCHRKHLLPEETRNAEQEQCVRWGEGQQAGPHHAWRSLPLGCSSPGDSSWFVFMELRRQVSISRLSPGQNKGQPEPGQQQHRHHRKMEIKLGSSYPWVKFTDRKTRGRRERWAPGSLSEIRCF